jgi:UDP-N-acetylmuramoyl-tripeptide--D-alanyl-D-alanine ligase
MTEPSATTPGPGPRFTPEELAAATGGRWTAGADAVAAALEGVSTDTRTLAPGALFVALRGERFDAHDHLAEAAARGAAAAVVSEEWLSTHAPASGKTGGLPLLAVGDTLAALGAIANHHRRRFRIPVVGVTGSNGKTTTREMIASILEGCGSGTHRPAEGSLRASERRVLRTEGNLNNEVGVPLTLLRLGPGHSAAVIELGMNHAGEIARIAALAQPYVGVVTNAGTAHLEHLGSRDGIADAKAELYAALPANGIVVANADDPRMLRRAQASGRRTVTFAAGRGRRGDVVAMDVRQGEDGLRFTLGIGNREVPVHVPGLVGEHNATNAAAAAACCVALGCTDREVQAGLAGVVPVGRRLRLERLPSGVRLVDDCYNANPDSMAAALRTAVALAGDGRVVAVLGDMLELGAHEAEAHRALGEEVARAGVRHLATFGPRTAATAEAARAAGLDPVHTEDLDALVAWTRANAAAPDVLLVKGSRGMKLERLVEALR